MDFPKPPSIIGKIILPLTGGVLGFLYYRFIGCAGGTCPIWSSPWLSTGYGALIGYLGSTAFSTKNTKKPDTE